MKKWMNRLAEKHKQMRQNYPTDELIIVFDIDDTILDLRHMIRHVLKSFDGHHRTHHFDSLHIEDIAVTERDVARMLREMGITGQDAACALDWFDSHAWSFPVVSDCHKPFPGALNVIAWLQSQPRTHVGLNTGRPESIRGETLRCLQKLGKPFGVNFRNELLYMNKYGWGKSIVDSKIEGTRYFQDKGYRITAFVDNEPENLRIVGNADKSGEILLLHADTVYAGDRAQLPPTAVSGNIYEISELWLHLEPDDDFFGKAA
jgi:hypothetical protein